MARPELHHSYLATWKATAPDLTDLMTIYICGNRGLTNHIREVITCNVVFAQAVPGRSADRPPASRIGEVFVIGKLSAFVGDLGLVGKGVVLRRNRAAPVIEVAGVSRCTEA